MQKVCKRKGKEASALLKKIAKGTYEDDDILNEASETVHSKGKSEIGQLKRMTWPFFKRFIISGGNDIKVAKKCWRRCTDEDGNKLPSYLWNKTKL